MARIEATGLEIALSSGAESLQLNAFNDFTSFTRSTDTIIWSSDANALVDKHQAINKLEAADENKQRDETEICPNTSNVNHNMRMRRQLISMKPLVRSVESNRLASNRRKYFYAHQICESFRDTADLLCRRQVSVITFDSGNYFLLSSQRATITFPNESGTVTSFVGNHIRSHLNSFRFVLTFPIDLSCAKKKCWNNDRLSDRKVTETKAENSS